MASWMRSMLSAKGLKGAQGRTREADVGAINGRGLRRAIFMAFLWLCIEGRLCAKTTAELLMNYLNQNGHSGRQVYDNSGDESMTLFEPMIFIGTDIGPDTNLSLSALYDTWTSASSQIFDNATGASTKSFDSVTLASQPSTTTPQPTPTTPADTGSTTGGTTSSTNGASSGTAGGGGSSGNTPYEHREAVNVGLSHKIGSWVLSPRIGYSTQVNYESYNGGMTVEKNLARDNFTLAFTYSLARDKSYFFDLTRKAFTGWIPKNTDTYEVSATQILGAHDLCLFGAGEAVQSGFLATTRNTVVVNGQRVQEILPALRHRQFYTARYAHAFNQFLAWHTDYRFYTDDWGIQAHSVEPFLALSFAEDDGLIRLGYRYHSQIAANYYVTSLAAPQVYMTSDSDLSAFDAQDVSLLASYTFDTPGTLFTTMQVGMGAMVYQRTNDLSVTVLQASLGATL